MIRALSVALAAAGPAAAQGLNDYPTVARADYVFACMAVNGQSADALQRCSCSIDVIAEIIPHDAYVDAETVLMMRQVSGERASAFRESAPANAMVSELRRAQAEAEIVCF